MSKYVSKDNAERVLSEYADAIKDKVDKVEGKGLSTNDFTDMASGKLNDIENGAEVNVLEGVQVDGTDLTISNKKVNVVISGKTDKVANATSGNLAGLDSNGNLTDSGSKASDFALASSLGTAAAKDYTSSVTSGSTDLVESRAVKDAIDTAVSSSYHHAGTKTCEELLPALLVAANEGNVYNITNDGTTTSDFIEGVGKPIREGDNVGVAKVSAGVYKFDLLSGLIDTSNFVSKSQTAGLLKNDGSVDTTITGAVSANTSAISGIKDGTSIDSFADVETALATKADKVLVTTANNLASLDVNGNLVDSGYSKDKLDTSTNTLTGNPLFFTTDSAQVASDCKITLEPIQEGSGDPSPSNVRSISGYGEISLVSCGKNLFMGNSTDNPQYNSHKYVNPNGSFANNESYNLFRLSVFPNRIYRMSGYDIATLGTSGGIIRFENDNYELLSSTDAGYGQTTFTFTTPANCAYIVFSLLNNNDGKYVLSIGSDSITSYEPYNPATDITLNLPETVYGDTLDVESGELVVDESIQDYTGVNSENWGTRLTSGGARLFEISIDDMMYISSSSIITYQCNRLVYDRTMPNEYSCRLLGNTFSVRMPTSIDTVDKFKTWLASNPIQIIYPLATPYTIHLTPAQVNLLKGANTVTTNGTTITLKYRDGELAKLEDLSGIGESINKLGEISGELVNDTDAILTVYGSKNLLPITIDKLKTLNTTGTWSDNSYTKNNVTYTVNTDKFGSVSSITLSGIPNANASFALANENNIENNLTYILSGTPAKKLCSIELEEYYSNSWHTTGYDGGEGLKFTLNANTTQYYVSIRINSSADFTTPVTFYPMIRDARIKDDTYAPYAKTNRELTLLLQEIAQALHLI